MDYRIGPGCDVTIVGMDGRSAEARTDRLLSFGQKHLLRRPDRSEGQAGTYLFRWNTITIAVPADNVVEWDERWSQTTWAVSAGWAGPHRSRRGYGERMREVR